MTPDTINAERDADDDRNDADTGSEINYRVPGLERGL